jgi:hypothetical protein
MLLLAVLLLEKIFMLPRKELLLILLILLEDELLFFERLFTDELMDLIYIIQIILNLISFTPLNIINRAPEGRLGQCSGATLPFLRTNQLYQAPIKDGSASEACNLAAPMGLLRRPDSNVHRCIRPS